MGAGGSTVGITVDSEQLLLRVEASYVLLTEARADVEAMRREFVSAVLRAREGGVSQGDIGERIGLSQQRVGQIEAAAQKGEA